MYNKVTGNLKEMNKPASLSQMARHHPQSCGAHHPLSFLVSRKIAAKSLGFVAVLSFRRRLFCPLTEGFRIRSACC